MRLLSGCRCLFEAIDQQFISDGLGNRSVHGYKSVFDRLGLFEPDGSPIRIRSHQFRHYLNTLAHAGGMSELDIAKWSGRANVQQNSAYNHVSDRDVQARLMSLKAGNDDSSAQNLALTRMTLLPRAKFAEMNIQAAHTTDFGYCVHDFAMSPCQIHLDCLNCNEHVCVKGDRYGEMNVKAMLLETEVLLAEARAAETDSAYGASRWVEHQQLTLERLTQLVGIADNLSVPHGAIIRPAHINAASRLQQAKEARKALPHQRTAALQPIWRIED